MPIEDYVKERDGNISVDWKKLIKDKKAFIEKASEGIDPKFYYDVLEYLKRKKIRL